jgi:hypothetical protein
MKCTVLTTDDELLYKLRICGNWSIEALFILPELVNKSGFNS